MLDFNSHAHVERDKVGSVIGGATSNFNSHAHVERDGHDRGQQPERYHFNSHAHVERDSGFVRVSLYALSFQLTRSRGA